MHEAEQSLLVWHCIHSAPIVKDTLRYDDRTAVYQAVSGKKTAASPGQNSRWFWLSSKKIQSQASLRRVHNAQHTVPTPRFHQSWQGKNMAIHFMHAHAHENIAAHEVWRCERHSTKQPECGMRFHQRWSFLLASTVNQRNRKNPGLSGHFLFWPVNIAHVTSPLVSQSTLNSLLSLANQTTVAAAGYGRPSISSSRALVNAVRSLVGSEMGQQRTKLGSQVDVGAVVPLQFGFTVPVLAVVDVEQASSDGVCLLLKPCRVVHLVLQTCTHMTENPVIYPQQTKICNP